MIRLRTIVLVIALVVAISGCGGGSSVQPAQSPAPPPPSAPSAGGGTVVAVTPNAVGQVWQGTTVQFTAIVVGQSNHAVTWAVQEGSTGGTIDGTGLYTAPSAAGTFHVIATSQADPKASGVASVEVVPVTVSISPPVATLRIGGSRQFVGSALAVDQHVTWNLEEGAAAGTITADGLYTARSTVGSFHVRATSIYNTNASGTAPVTIVNTGFVPISDMSVARSGHTATLLLDGRVLVAGGTDDTAHSAELFNPATTSFDPPSSGMIHVRAGHCAALLPNGKVLIAGGGDSSGTLFETAELFDPATQTFSVTGNLGQARTYATATPLPGGKVLIAGGQDSQGTPLSSAELYDPATGVFSLTGKLHAPRAQHTATLLTNGTVLLLGNSTSTAEAEIFDPATGNFTTTGSLNTSRAHHTATLLSNGNVLVLGGTQSMPPGGGGAAPAPVSLDSAEVYDPTKGQFQTAGKLLIARDSHSATLLSNGTVLVAGGYSHDFDGDAVPEFYTMLSAELFDPTSSASTAAASLEAERAEHVATLLNNGEVLVTGGRTGSGETGHGRTLSLATAELYH